MSRNFPAHSGHPIAEGNARRLIPNAGTATTACGNGASDALEKLTKMGFRKAADWRLESGSLECLFQEFPTAQNILYAFLSEGTVVYIGKTVRTLQQRMYGYRRPVRTQSTNIKGNRLILEALDAGRAVEVYALPDSGLLYYGGFHINLAAGLEDSLVATLKPAWNKLGI